MSVVGLVVLLAVLAGATVIGTVLRARAGRVRRTSAVAAPSGWALAGATPDHGDRVLLLQLSSPVCSPCRQTAAQLEALATERPGLRHVEVDVAEAPETARALHVMRTPTTVAFDRDGRELLRVAGVPRRADLLEALGGRLDGTGADPR
jgi:thiol-disulfide isomerase/thioredoxin